MSVVNSKRLQNTRAAVDYELFGAKGSQKYKENLAAGTDRVVGLRMDAPDIEAFVARAEQLARKHNRRVETRSMIQSFSKDEIDVDDPAQLQKVTDMGYLLAKELYPNSYCLVITHIDGKGGHPHNHIKVLNHDNVTGRALERSNMFYNVQRANDKVMRENDLSVVERSWGRDNAKYWEHARDGAEPFDLWLGDTIREALNDPRSVDVASYHQALADRGIELIEERFSPKRDGQKRESVGWTYRAMDEIGPKRRKRRRKSSALADEFTHDGATLVFQDKAAEQQRKAATPAPAPSWLDDMNAAFEEEMGVELAAEQQQLLDSFNKPPERPVTAQEPVAAPEPQSRRRKQPQRRTRPVAAPRKPQPQPAPQQTPEPPPAKPSERPVTAQEPSDGEKYVEQHRKRYQRKQKATPLPGVESSNPFQKWGAPKTGNALQDALRDLEDRTQQFRSNDDPELER